MAYRRPPAGPAAVADDVGVVIGGGGGGGSSGGPSMAATMGLRNFSRQVWLKVMEKKVTDYNQVADEMLLELRAEAMELARARVGDGPEAMAVLDPKQFDERNVRRRVYDALNVLMAVGVIKKDKSTRKIMWKGLPNKIQDELDVLEHDVEARHAKVLEKRRIVHDLILQQLAFRRLAMKNSVAEQAAAKLVPNLIGSGGGTTATGGGMGSTGTTATVTTATAVASTSPTSPPTLSMSLTGAETRPVSTSDSTKVTTATSSSSTHPSSSSSAIADASGIASRDDGSQGGATGSVPMMMDAVGVPSARPATAIHLPFVVVTTSNRATVNVEMDVVTHSHAILRFDSPFQVWDYKEILKRMNLQDFNDADLSTMVPPHLQPFVLPETSKQLLNEPSMRHDSEKLLTVRGDASSSWSASLSAGPKMPKPPAAPSLKSVRPQLPLPTALPATGDAGPQPPKLINERTVMLPTVRGVFDRSIVFGIFRHALAVLPPHGLVGVDGVPLTMASLLPTVERMAAPAVATEHRMGLPKELCGFVAEMLAAMAMQQISNPQYVAIIHAHNTDAAMLRGRHMQMVEAACKEPVAMAGVGQKRSRDDSGVGGTDAPDAAAAMDRVQAVVLAEQGGLMTNLRQMVFSLHITEVANRLMALPHATDEDIASAFMRGRLFVPVVGSTVVSEAYMMGGMAHMGAAPMQVRAAGTTPTPPLPAARGGGSSSGGAGVRVAAKAPAHG